jgi:hypothetical protein
VHVIDGEKTTREVGPPPLQEERIEDRRGDRGYE